MIRTVLQILIPPIAGVSGVLILLMGYNLIAYNRDFFHSPENGFFTIFVPSVTIAALLFQVVCVIPFTKKISLKRKSKKSVYFFSIAFVSLFFGTLSGLFFSERSSGFSEIIFLALTGVIVFVVYFTIMLITKGLMFRSNSD